MQSPEALLSVIFLTYHQNGLSIQALKNKGNIVIFFLLTTVMRSL